MKCAAQKYVRLRSWTVAGVPAMFLCFSDENHLLQTLIAATYKTAEYLTKECSMYEPVCLFLRSLRLPLALATLHLLLRTSPLLGQRRPGWQHRVQCWGEVALRLLERSVFWPIYVVLRYYADIFLHLDILLKWTICRSGTVAILFLFSYFRLLTNTISSRHNCMLKIAQVK